MARSHARSGRSAEGVKAAIKHPCLPTKNPAIKDRLSDAVARCLGGLKESTKQDQRSGVPILNKIPLLNFLFERKGNFISNRKLLILLKAQIVILSEYEPTPAQLGQDESLQPR